jgi:DNA-binding GntR family transcriptional regulator
MRLSRSPVREALYRLELEGLVCGEPNRACYVWVPTEADVDEIISLRIMSESLAAEWAIGRLVEEDYAELGLLIELQGQAIEARDLLENTRHDRRFHEYTCLKAGHRRLLEWWRRIMGQWQTLVCRRMQHSAWADSSRARGDHQAILDALRGKDLDGVLRLHRTINQRLSAEMKEALRA